MEKRNRYSSIYDKKSSVGLKRILSSADYEDEAKLAATWELERRGDASDDELATAEKVELHVEKETERVYQIEKYHTFWPRFWAALIDFFVVSLSLMTAFMFLSEFPLITAILNVLSVLYYCLLHGFQGQTLGKMVMNVRAVHEDEMRKISFKQAFMRDIIPLGIVALQIALFIVFSISTKFSLSFSFNGLSTSFQGVPFLWALAKLITMLIHEKLRGVHDLIAKTVVIRVKD